MEISQPLEELDWIPRPKILALRRLGITTAENLLTHFPRRHEDRHQFPQFPREESNTPICLSGEVTKTSLRRFGGWKKIFEATLEEPNSNALSQPLICRWFNLHYVQKMIATGQQLVVFGKPRLRGKRICMEHPEFEVIENDEERSIHLRRITPIYPATEGLSQRLLRGMIYRLLQELDTDPIEPLLPEKLKNGDRGEAIRAIHFPETWKSRDAAREHLVLSEFFAMQMLIASRRNESHSRTSAVHSGAGKLLEKFLRSLPFELTTAQRKVMDEIRRDLAAKHPMNRLLQGDVGSGKTVVAIAAILLAVEAGYQAAFMAPTQILAEQHYAVLRRWLEPLGVKLAIRTASRREETGPLPLFEHAENPGGARVSRVGDGVPASRTYAEHPDIGMSRYSRRRLPHFEHPWAIYGVTLVTKSRRTLSPSARTLVIDALRHFHGQRYELIAACVMPDHVHFLIQPWPKEYDEEGMATFWPLASLLHSVKSFSAHKINNLEGTNGAVWEKERFDRYIRSDRDLEEKYRYIVTNPWRSEVVGSSEDYSWIWTQEDENQFPRDAETHTRDACVTQKRRTEADVIIGTHALLYEKVSFSNLGLAVIDEQHKFGVAQRARLTSREPAPDVLVMTATPIPRTITMTVYGDLDVSILDEMPRGRGKIITAVRDSTKLGEVLSFLRTQLEAGRQIYVVYPLVDESEKLEAKAAAAEYERWRERLHPYSCELLHGRIPGPEKQEIMGRFRCGETQALISTTVIEVGVDVPNATVMLIENAERFGLAQLHQLRGRIGRGEHKSYCILLTSEPSSETAEKLGVLEKTIDGFEVAEADWEMRGPGDLLGTAQSGLPGLKIGNLKRDAELMQRARQAAMSIFAGDPALESPQNQRFQQLIVEQEGRTFSNIS
ncbi:MAG TPA: ATP-dependent DNA helicase RecG [Chthoniobacterales bacterium]|nr:ATP-dependent DNA helicase RecG [Chthoniobacterales bacterium]